MTSRREVALVGAEAALRLDSKNRVHVHRPLQKASVVFSRTGEDDVHIEGIYWRAVEDRGKSANQNEFRAAVVKATQRFEQVYLLAFSFRISRISRICALQETQPLEPA